MSMCRNFVISEGVSEDLAVVAHPGHAFPVLVEEAGQTEVLHFFDSFMDSVDTAITFPPTLTEIGLSLSLEQGRDWAFIGCSLEFSVDGYEYGLSWFHNDSRFKNS